jgi:hypothetical protein
VLEAVAALDVRLPFADQGFELDGADFRAVLLLLAALLPVFIVLELAFDAGSLFVEQVGQAPEEIAEIGFEAGILERAGKDIEDVRDRAREPVGFGQGARIGFAG